MLKNSRRCREKRILKWTCTKHVSFRPFFEVPMLKKCTPLWREAHFLHRTPHARTNFESFAGKKWHAAVVRRYMSKSKCTKHVRSEALFVREMSKNCTPLRREAHSQVKMLKNWRLHTTFSGSDVEKLHAVVARSTCVICVSQNVQITCVLVHFLKFRCRTISQLALIR